MLRPEFTNDGLCLSRLGVARMRRLACLLLFYAVWWTSCANAVEISATVVRVVDGDTIIVAPMEGLHLSTRLLWIDTPESRAKNGMAEGH